MANITSSKVVSIDANEVKEILCEKLNIVNDAKTRIEYVNDGVSSCAVTKVIISREEKHETEVKHKFSRGAM